MGILFLCVACKLFSNTGVPHFFVDVISANNIRYYDQESASGGHFLYRTFLKWWQSTLQFHKKALIFARRQQRSSYCLLNFKRQDLKYTKSSQIFRIFMVCTYVIDCEVLQVFIQLILVVLIASAVDTTMKCSKTREQILIGLPWLCRQQLQFPEPLDLLSIILFKMKDFAVKF